MKLLRSSRLILMALLLSLIPAASYAGVFISVGIAPPPLPVYEQPPCPESGWLWTPGYWAYGEDGYYWVPGAWVPAPYEGALWTPGYWGWSDGFYLFHPGYWGPHVGYYGGVNYGFGYMGVGFVGGRWHDHDFLYNTAVVHVNERVIHTTYVDRTIVERNTIVNDRHVAFSGGPGGIRHDPRPEERLAERDRHMERTSFQTEHVNEAMHDRGSYFKSNGGRPQNLAVARPMGYDNHSSPGEQRHFDQPNNQGNQNHQQEPQNRQAQQSPLQPRDNHQAPVGRQNYEARPAQPQQPQYRQPEQPQQPQYQPRDNHQAPAGHPNNYEARPAQPEQPQYRQPQQPQQPQYQPRDNHQAPAGRPNNYEARPAPPQQPQYRQPEQPQYRQQQQPEYRQPQQPQYQPRDNHQAPAGRPNNEARPAPQQRPQGHPEQQSRPQHESKDGHGKGR